MQQAEAAIDEGGAAGRPITVLQVVPEMAAGGVERTTLDVARALVATGHRAVVASAGGRLVPELEALGARHVTMPLATKNPGRMVANTGALTALAREIGADILHARSRAPAWSALLAARRAGCRFVTTYHGAYAQGSGLGGRVKGAYNGVMARGDVVIANSRFTRDLVLTRHAGVIGDPARVRVIHRGTDLDRFDPAAIAPGRIAALRASWGLGAGGRVVLLPARLTSWKGHEACLDAVARLSDPAITCVFAGDAQGRTDYVAQLEARARSLGVRLVLPGHAEDVATAYAAADLVAVPSTAPEAFGRTAVEAQAMGRPVIVTDHGAMPETVVAHPEPGWTGWRVAPGRAEDLADAMRQALALSTEARAALAERARAQAGRFSLSRMLAQTLAVYRDVLRDGDGARDT